MTTKSYHALARAKGAALAAVMLRAVVVVRRCNRCACGPMPCGAVSMPVTSWGTCPDFAPAGVAGVAA
jgi:hypothetical protein